MEQPSVNTDCLEELILKTLSVSKNPFILVAESEVPDLIEMWDKFPDVNVVVVRDQDFEVAIELAKSIGKKIKIMQTNTGGIKQP